MKREILIVEDHINMMNSLTYLLAQVYPEFEILTVGNGEDAIGTAQSRPLSLILMDLNLPPFNGFEAARRIKASRPEIPILIMTNEDGDWYKDIPFSAGADVYLSKSRIAEELLPKINKLLNSV